MEVTVRQNLLRSRRMCANPVLNHRRAEFDRVQQVCYRHTVALMRGTSKPSVRDVKAMQRLVLDQENVRRTWRTLAGVADQMYLPWTNLDWNLRLIWLQCMFWLMDIVKELETIRKERQDSHN